MSQEVYIFFKKRTLLNVHDIILGFILIKSEIDKSTFWNVGTNQDILFYRIHHHIHSNFFGTPGPLLMKKCSCKICGNQIRIYLFLILEFNWKILSHTSDIPRNNFTNYGSLFNQNKDS